MKSLSPALVAYLLLSIFPPVLRCEERSPEGSLYFPPDQGAWKTVQPEQVDWDRTMLQEALDYAGRNQSSGVVILYRGRILAERYFKIPGERSAKYRRRVLGRDKVGGAIEDVASAQKSIASILVGIAQQKRLLRIDDRVSQHLGVGWSRATPKQENAITIRHLITMTSGLTDRLLFETRPGTKWRYNTAAYAKSMDAVAAAAAMDRHELTKRWLTQPLGMSDSRWVKRGSPAIQRINGFGFATSPRDLARFGLMILATGRWGDKTVLADPEFLKEATTSSQKLNPSYGYLWWLNRNSRATRSASRVKTAPRDMIFASGALNRRCFVVPSLQLVVTRLGDAPAARRDFDRQFWKLLTQASPARNNPPSGSPDK